MNVGNNVTLDSFELCMNSSILCEIQNEIVFNSKKIMISVHFCLLIHHSANLAK